MYAWEPFFLQKVEMIRAKEIRILIKNGILRATNTMITYFIPVLVRAKKSIELICFVALLNRGDR